MTGRRGNLLKKGRGDEPTDFHGRFRLSSFEIHFSLKQQFQSRQPALQSTTCDMNTAAVLLGMNWNDRLDTTLFQEPALSEASSLFCFLHYRLASTCCAG